MSKTRKATPKRIESGKLAKITSTPQKRVAKLTAVKCLR